MPNHKISIVKSEFKLRVLDNGSEVVREYPIAIGERADGKARIYEEDFRTPEGDFWVKYRYRLAMHEDGADSEPEGPNSKYYPFYLAHKFESPFVDSGYSVYGHGIIALAYPMPEDIQNYKKLLDSGEIIKDWHGFMEEKWRGLFEYASETRRVAFEEIRFSHDKRKGEKRNFLEGKTFSEFSFSPNS